MPLLLALLFAVLAWRDLKLAVLLLAGTLPVYLLRFDVFGVPSTMLEVMVWVVVGVWVVKGLKDRKWEMGNGKGKGKSPFRSLRAPITLLLLAGVISVFSSPDLFSALGILKAYFIEPLLIFVLVVSVFDRTDLHKLFIAFGISAIALSLFAFFQRLTGIGLPIPYDTARRVTSIFSYPNALGLFLAPILASTPFLFLQAKRDGNTLLKIFFALVFFLSALTLLFSETQGAWIAVPIAIFLTTLIPASKKPRRLFLGLALLFACLVVILPPFPLSPSLTVRLSQWQETWTYLKDGHLLLGAGLSGYPSAIAPYHTATQYEIFQYPHNIFLNFWVELGMIGLISLIGLIGSMFLLIKQNKNNLFVLAVTAGLLEMLVHGLVDVPYFKNDLAILTWLFVAVIVVSSKTKTSA